MVFGEKDMTIGQNLGIVSDTAIIVLMVLPYGNPCENIAERSETEHNQG